MPLVNSKRVIVAAGMTSSNAPPAASSSIEGLGGPILFAQPAPLASLPPPLPTEAAESAANRVVTDVVALSKSIGETTRALSQNFCNLSAVSQAYVQEAAASTAQSCETLLQASNFLDFQVNASIDCSRQILHNMEKIHLSMLSAKKLLSDIKGASESVTALEALLAQMEKERGIAQPKKKGLFS